MYPIFLSLLEHFELTNRKCLKIGSKKEAAESVQSTKQQEYKVDRR